MEKFIITTDVTADLSKNYLEENGIGLLPMTFEIDGKEYSEDNFDTKDFYNKMRKGLMPKTSQVNSEKAKEKFREYLIKGYNVLHISFSSGLSGSYNSTRIASIELQDEFKENRVFVVDSLCASLGEGLLVHKAVQLKNNGQSIEEIIDWIEANKLHICHYVTVDDLNHLYRGGRVSKTTAIIGTMIGVKPIIKVDDEGHLIPIAKSRGRKKSLNMLVDKMEELIGSYKSQNDIIFISHGDAEEDAEYVAKKIEERFNIKSFLINSIGFVVGSHSGPGTIALFFMGEKR